LPVRTGIRPMAGFAEVLASQVSPCPGPARQSPRPPYGVGGGGQSLTRHLVRTARSPRCGPARKPVPGPFGRAYTRPAGSGYCRARGGSRGLLPQAGAARLAREPLGESRSRRTECGGAGCRYRSPKTCAAQVTEDLAVPGPVPVSWSPDGATVRPVRRLLVLLVVHPRVALPRAAYPRAPFPRVAILRGAACAG
jgi:hypothetical protein